LKLNEKNLFLHLCAIRFPLFYFGIARSESQLKLFVFARFSFSLLHFSFCRRSLLLSALGFHLPSGDFSLPRAERANPFSSRTPVSASGLHFTAEDFRPRLIFVQIAPGSVSVRLSFCCPSVDAWLRSEGPAIGLDLFFQLPVSSARLCSRRVHRRLKSHVDSTSVGACFSFPVDSRLFCRSTLKRWPMESLRPHSSDLAPRSWFLFGLASCASSRLSFLLRPSEERPQVWLPHSWIHFSS
jgi:hypothetical protein